MNAAVLYKLGEELVVKQGIDIPVLKYGQVLVKIEYSGLCHSQLNEIKGLRGEDKYLPHLLGHEGTGTVVEIGENVKKVKPGDKVVLGWIEGDGINAGGTSYYYNNSTINAGPVTTFSDYAIISENRCYLLPKDIPMDIGVLFGCAIPTGCGIVINEIQALPGKSIAVFGLGGVGMSALIATKLYDFEKIIAIDIESLKLKLAEEFGATDIINANNYDVKKKIDAITNGVGVDYSVEATGIASNIEKSFSILNKKTGLCVFASHPPTGSKICLDPHEMISGKRIKGSWGGGSKPDRDIVRFAELYRNGQLPLKKLLSKCYSLKDINQAVFDLENRKIIRALIDMSLI